jgi:hypothetical protein
VLATLTGEDPLLVTTFPGQGRAAVLPANLLPVSTDLAASPMALPFLQRLVAWLARPSVLAAGVNLEVGQPAAVRPLGADAGRNLDDLTRLRVHYQRSGLTEAATLTWRGEQPRLTGEVLEKAGFVTFVAGSDTVGLVAAAVPAVESALDLEDPAAWARRLAGLGLQVSGDLTDTAPQDIVAAFEGRPLAPWLLALAFLLLLAEMAAARGLSGSGSAAAPAAD